MTMDEWIRIANDIKVRWIQIISIKVGQNNKKKILPLFKFELFSQSSTRNSK